MGQGSNFRPRPIPLWSSFIHRLTENCKNHMKLKLLNECQLSNDASTEFDIETIKVIIYRPESGFIPRPEKAQNDHLKNLEFPNFKI